MPIEKVSKYNLVTGEDTYAQQNAQNPATSRRVIGWINDDDGSLTREWNEPKWSTAQLTNGSAIPVVYMYEFDQIDPTTGSLTRYYFAVGVIPASGSPLKPQFILKQLVAGVWTTVTVIERGSPTLAIFSSIPAFVSNVNGDNLLHISDGTFSFIFDGTQAAVPQGVGATPQFYEEGMRVQTGTFDGGVQSGPSIDASQAGTFNCSVGRYYWTTNADHAATRIHESSSSAPSASSGALVNKKVIVYQRPGLFSCVSGSPTITVTASPEAPGSNGAALVADWMFGCALYINGQFIGMIGGTAANQLTLAGASVAGVTITNGRAVICDRRATHWHVYASESDGSKIGQLLAQVPVTTMSYTDQSPFLGIAGNLFSSIFRPVRNDPPVASDIIESHKFRQWRRRDGGILPWPFVTAKPYLFSFSANEEVSSGANGNPSECSPGTATGTISDIVNENPYPEETMGIRAMKSHADALYIFSEKNCIPLYGESIDDFGLSQISAFNVGAAGPKSVISTPHGLMFVSYDKNVFLYPSSNYPWAYVPKDINVTAQLIDIGRPITKKLEAMRQDALVDVRLVYYKYGRRDWAVLTYQDTSSTGYTSLTPAPVYHTWVYDFKTKTWFEINKNIASVAVFTQSDGVQVLVGGGVDGFIYVLDDLTGSFASSGNMPTSLLRTALIDFNAPDNYHVPQYVEYEVSNPAMANDLTVNFYLDPANADSPGVPIAITMKPVKRGSNLFRGFFQGGRLCRRLMVEISAASSNVATNFGFLRGIKLASVKGPEVVG